MAKFIVRHNCTGHLPLRMMDVIPYHALEQSVNLTKCGKTFHWDRSPRFIKWLLFIADKSNHSIQTSLLYFFDAGGSIVCMETPYLCFLSLYWIPIWYSIQFYGLFNIPCEYHDLVYKIRNFTSQDNFQSHTYCTSGLVSVHQLLFNFLCKRGKAGQGQQKQWKQKSPLLLPVPWKNKRVCQNFHNSRYKAY